jgi:hypothetical protein
MRRIVRVLLVLLVAALLTVPAQASGPWIAPGGFTLASK